MLVIERLLTSGSILEMAKCRCVFGKDKDTTTKCLWKRFLWKRHFTLISYLGQVLFPISRCVFGKDTLRLFPVWAKQTTRCSGPV